MNNKTNKLTTELETYIQEAIKQGCICIADIADYIENKTGVRYAYGRVLRVLYEV